MSEDAGGEQASVSEDAGGEPAVTRVRRLRAGDAGLEPEEARVACEEPLEIQVGSSSLAVVMRTPGHDRELALGFLWTERVIERPDQVVSVTPHARTR
ncbi:MAG TPA: formate dehydrogenase accessory sulfurtransferase FdhD, partial [Myxococcota bacterium]|nr:formate dehydrogenase accessory sulfurtransferase FdhD [Myxococcota bacterium]